MIQTCGLVRFTHRRTAFISFQVIGVNSSFLSTLLTVFKSVFLREWNKFVYGFCLSNRIFFHTNRCKFLIITNGCQLGRPKYLIFANWCSFVRYNEPLEIQPLRSICSTGNTCDMIFLAAEDRAFHSSSSIPKDWDSFGLFQTKL